MATVGAARQAWRRLEPLHAMIYFVPEAPRRYRDLGVADVMTGYFASRVAAMGAVSAEVVIATFFNFCPDLVRRGIPQVWEVASPEKLIAARLDAVGSALRRVGIHELPELPATLELARRAAEEACHHVQGRPLFAAHAAQPWPDDPLLQLWHAQTLLREYRGDGHIAALVSEGLTGLEALILYAAMAHGMDPLLKATRGWPQEAWTAAEEGLRARGLLGDGLSLTDHGQEFRQAIEDRTDVLAFPAYAVLDDEECERLAELARVFGRAVVGAGLLNFR
ncbi:hypothetical protein Aph01nite_67360 [Acrocarpospora phusangensis]|uniref:SalK n=1 Tax=Acrocarpospora phusangensis TaxID=1070424 RepID=A0A919UNE9_9ACTN|nr:hypothetical protein [Acrocarpospora phusangensis]GIH28426.1 hypothetical protein Aph01nite_67360 [Acrocarpospora phusangensis]